MVNARPSPLYGSLKMWAHLQRQGIPVARCTVERIMRENGWRGAMRARRVRTTVADPAATRAPDLVRRRFRAPGPTRCMWPISLMCRWPAAGSAIPRS